MLVNVRVITQALENKAFVDGGTPVWRPKGARTFNMPVEDDAIMYVGEDELKAAIQTALDGMCTNLYKFEVIEYDIEFHNTITLPDNVLGDALMVS